MKSELDVRLTLFAGIVTFAIIALLKEEPSLKELWSAISAAVSITTIGRYIFVTWLWKYLPFLRRVHGIPNLEGKWDGQFQSTWSATPGDPTATGPIEVKITQPNIFKVKLTQKSGESISYSTGESIESLEDGSTYLNFSYRNEPNASVRGRSQINYGSARYLLEESAGSVSLRGNYFTDRKSTGEVSIAKIS